MVPSTLSGTLTQGILGNCDGGHTRGMARTRLPVSLRVVDGPTAHDLPCRFIVFAVTLHADLRFRRAALLAFEGHVTEEPIPSDASSLKQEGERVVGYPAAFTGQPHDPIAL